MEEVSERLREAHRCLQAGRLDEAEARFRDLSAAEPQNPAHLYMLGVVARAGGRPAAALAPLEKAMAIAPGDNATRLMYAGCLNAAGRTDDAERACRAVLETAPGEVAAHTQLGEICLQRGAAAAALEHYRAAHRGDPDSAALQARVGRLLAVTGDIAEGLAMARAASERAPESPAVAVDLARALNIDKRFDETARVLDRALAAAPDDLGLLHAYAATLRRQNRLRESADQCQKIIARHPGDAEAHHSLGMVEMNHGHMDAARAAYLRAAALDPTNPLPESNAAMVMLYSDRFSPGEIADAHRTWARRHADRLGAAAAPFANRPDPDRRLKVGFVSGDFRAHSVVNFVAPLFESGDRKSLEIHGFDTGVRDDETTARLAAAADGWHRIAAIGDDDAATLIRDLGIDILVDLSGRTAGNRMFLFAARAAPVQVAYLGYPATTGLAAMDIRLTDSVADPPGATEAWHTERLVRLDPCFLCYRPPADAPPVAPPPTARNGAPTFGSFNNVMKISERSVALWSDVLRAVPDARLLLKFGFLAAADVRESLIARFGARGIAAERLDLRGRDDDPRQHLARYDEIDIALDTVPYNGTTTTCEALWMGVPVLTFAGPAHVSRVGASILTAAGYPDLICRDGPDLVRRAFALARDGDALAKIRGSMRDQVGRSPLTDEAAHARRFEAALRTAWRAWCAGPSGGGEDTP